MWIQRLLEDSLRKKASWLDSCFLLFLYEIQCGEWTRKISLRILIRNIKLMSFKG